LMFHMVGFLKHYLKWALGNETWKLEKPFTDTVYSLQRFLLLKL
jgi:hypothetical protein